MTVLVDESVGGAVLSKLTSLGLYKAPHLEALLFTGFSHPGYLPSESISAPISSSGSASFPPSESAKKTNHGKNWINSAESILSDVVLAELALVDVKEMFEAVHESLYLLAISKQVGAETEKSEDRRVLYTPSHSPSSTLRAAPLPTVKAAAKLDVHADKIYSAMNAFSTGGAYVPLESFVPVGLLPLICFDSGMFSSLWSLCQSTYEHDDTGEDGVEATSSVRNHERDRDRDELVSPDMQHVAAVLFNIMSLLTGLSGDNMRRLTPPHALVLLYQITSYPALNTSTKILVDQYSDILKSLLKSIETFFSPFKKNVIPAKFSQWSSNGLNRNGSMYRLVRLQQTVRVAYHLYVFFRSLTFQTYNSVYKLCATELHMQTQQPLGKDRAKDIYAFRDCNDSTYRDRNCTPSMHASFAKIPVARNKNPLVEAVRSASLETVSLLLSSRFARYSYSWLFSPLTCESTRATYTKGTHGFTTAATTSRTFTTTTNTNSDMKKLGSEFEYDSSIDTESDVNSLLETVSDRDCSGYIQGHVAVANAMGALGSLSIAQLILSHISAQAEKSYIKAEAEMRDRAQNASEVIREGPVQAQSEAPAKEEAEVKCEDSRSKGARRKLEASSVNGVLGLQPGSLNEKSWCDRDGWTMLHAVLTGCEMAAACRRSFRASNSLDNFGASRSMPWAERLEREKIAHLILDLEFDVPSNCKPIAKCRDLTLLDLAAAHGFWSVLDRMLQPVRNGDLEYLHALSTGACNTFLFMHVAMSLGKWWVVGLFYDCFFNIERVREANAKLFHKAKATIRRIFCSTRSFIGKMKPPNLMQTEIKLFCSYLFPANIDMNTFTHSILHDAILFGNEAFAVKVAGVVGHVLQSEGIENAPNRPLVGFNNAGLLHYCVHMDMPLLMRTLVVAPFNSLVHMYTAVKLPFHPLSAFLCTPLETAVVSDRPDCLSLILTLSVSVPNSISSSTSESMSPSNLASSTTMGMNAADSRPTDDVGQRTIRPAPPNLVPSQSQLPLSFERISAAISLAFGGKKDRCSVVLLEFFGHFRSIAASTAASDAARTSSDGSCFSDGTIGVSGVGVCFNDNSPVILTPLAVDTQSRICCVHGLHRTLSLLIRMEPFQLQLSGLYKMKLKAPGSSGFRSGFSSPTRDSLSPIRTDREKYDALVEREALAKLEKAKNELQLRLLPLYALAVSHNHANAASVVLQRFNELQLQPPAIIKGEQNMSNRVFFRLLREAVASYPNKQSYPIVGSSIFSQGRQICTVDESTEPSLSSKGETGFELMHINYNRFTSAQETSCNPSFFNPQYQLRGNGDLHNYTHVPLVSRTDVPSPEIISRTPANSRIRDKGIATQLNSKELRRVPHHQQQQQFQFEIQSKLRNVAQSKQLFSPIISTLRSPQLVMNTNNHPIHTASSYPDSCIAPTAETCTASDAANPSERLVALKKLLSGYYRSHEYADNDGETDGSLEQDGHHGKDIESEDYDGQTECQADLTPTRSLRQHISDVVVIGNGRQSVVIRRRGDASAMLNYPSYIPTPVPASAQIDGHSDNVLSTQDNSMKTPLTPLALNPGKQFIFSEPRSSSKHNRKAIKPPGDESAYFSPDDSSEDKEENIL